MGTDAWIATPLSRLAMTMRERGTLCGGARACETRTDDGTRVQPSGLKRDSACIYICICRGGLMPQSQHHEPRDQREAKLFRNNKSQAVRIPADFELPGDRV